MEFIKLLCGKNVESVLQEFADVLNVILPNMEVALSAKLVSLVKDDPTLRLAALLFDSSLETASAVCKRLKLSNRMTNDVTTLVGNRNIDLYPTRSHVLRALNQLGPELLRDILCIRTYTDHCNYEAFQAMWDRLIMENDLCYRTKHLAITGSDLMAEGVPSGPEIGATLSFLLDAVINGTCPNRKEKLLELATKKPVQ